MYSLELIKISEAYTKQMYKANNTESTVAESTVNESTVAESTRRVVTVTDGNTWAVVDADTQEIIQQYDSADKLNKDVREFGWLMVDEKPINISECGKQCNESYEEFYVKLEKEPFNILEDDCWQCDALLTLIRNNDKEEEFNTLAKETFMDNAPTITEFNDWCRFDDSIYEYLGLSDEDEDNDDEDEDNDDELDESGTTAGASDKTDAGAGKTDTGKGVVNGADAGKGAGKIDTGKGAKGGNNGTNEVDDIVAGVNGETGAKTSKPKPSWWDTTVDTVDRKYKELEDWAKRNPGLAMGAAAGAAGLGTALLTRKRRRRR